MTDPTRVRFPCDEHGVWFRHMIKPEPGLHSHTSGRSIKTEWCDGGTTRLLKPEVWQHIGEDVIHWLEVTQ